MTPKHYERRFTGRYPKVAHLVHERQLGNATQWYVTACGLGGDRWQGSGTQDEYEKAAELPVCRNCTKRIAEEAEWKVGELRALATGMPDRSRATREELLAWLRENKPRVFDMVPTRKRKDEE